MSIICPTLTRYFTASLNQISPGGSGKNTATLKGHTRRIYSVAFSPDGKTLASGSSDKSIKLWDVASGKKD